MMNVRTLTVGSVVLATMLASTGTAIGAPNNDPGAGAWSMIVLSSPAQFGVAAPLSTTSLDYQSELAEIRSAQAQLSGAQRTAVQYWSKGGVIRWNEIMIELVSRADLPPAPRADGTYPAPDPNNPFADPNFPFGNPPYASRAYSYVSVAQYEALKVAWYYKYLYNRPSPSAVDTSIKPLIPTDGLPSYPSEDAVLAGVSVPLLKLLFPVSASAIDAKAAEQLQVAKLAGKATASDIAAGYALGEAVAQVLIARARADGMGTAGGNAEIWKALTDAARARGDVPWISQDIPPRPPMLPLFGKVKTWMITADDLEKERPGPPPTASEPLMLRDLAEVKQIVANLTREQRAIAIKWADGVSTPTPPGHWNFIAESYVADAKWSEVRAARAFALLDMALHDAAVACWDTKYYYSNARPAQLDPQIKTAIGLPNFPSYTSGHSTFSGAAAEVLSYLFPSGRTTFETYRDEAAMSRLYGGIHYRTDNEVGLAHGKRIGGYTVQFAGRDGADR
ncbi:MAG: phosphatase PAP2 family protein [Vicinamibacterales bacterium]